MSERILIVDDEAGVLKLVSRILTRCGMDAHTASSGPEAIARMQTESFDVVLVDLRMPEMDGFEVLEWIRNEQTDIVSMVLSGTTLLEDAIQAIRHGAFDFVTKPIEGHEIFVEQVRRALQHKKLQDSNVELLNQLQEKNIELENRLGQLALAHSMLQAQAKAIQADLNHARSIQQALLPREFPFWQQMSLAGIYKPAGKVGGDFCDIFKLDSHKLGLYIADTTGHGVSSALITIFLKYAVQPFQMVDGVQQIVDPGVLVRSLNQLVFSEPFGHDVFVSLTYIIVDTQTFEISYANAGHPPLLIRKADGSVESLRSPAPALGINPNVKYATATTALPENASLVLHTDGVTDVQDAAHEHYGKDRLIEQIRNGPAQPQELVETIRQDLVRFSGHTTFNDDVTLLVLSITPQASSALDIAEIIELKAPKAVEGATGLTTAEQGDRVFISIAGEGTWRESQFVKETYQLALKDKLPLLVLDFAGCTHLDSTFLGILHNICTQSEDENATDVELQRLPRMMLKEISELGLTNVLMHFRCNPKKLPDSMTSASGSVPQDEAMGQLLLEAHEALVDADPKNADRFAAVLKVLHDQARRAGTKPKESE